MPKFMLIILINISLIVTLTHGLEIWSHSGGFHSYSGSSDHSTIDHGGSFSSDTFSTHDPGDSSSSSSGGCGPITAALGLCRYSYTYYQAPIYGPTGYTYGQINRMFDVNTGSNSGNYNGYSNNYWICVNNYRGQYYYSYTYGKYICDARANRYGQQQQQQTSSYPNYSYQNYGK